MGTLINGIKEIFASASQTSPTNIPTCAADGTPNGNITIANLASVLGETIDYGEGNANNMRGGWHMCFNNVTNLPQNAGAYGLLLTIAYATTMKVQYYHDTNDLLWSRQYSGSQWNAWHQTSTDYPSFYKNYNNIDALAAACFDTTPPETVAASYKTAGTYYSGGDIIIVFASGSHVFQIFVQCSSNDTMWGVFARTLNPSTDEWWPWRPLSRRRTT